MQDFPIAEVYWGDAWIKPEDYSLKEAQQLKPVKRKTVGYLVAETNEATEEKDKNIVNTPMVIPIGMISEWYIIGN